MRQRREKEQMCGVRTARSSRFSAQHYSLAFSLAIFRAASQLTERLGQAIDYMNREVVLAARVMPMGVLIDWSTQVCPKL